MSTPVPRSSFRPGLLLGLAVLLGGTVWLPAQLRIEAVTSPARETQYANDAEASPLGANASAKRAAALLYVENDHAHHVAICGPLFEQMVANRQHFANEINSQFLISSASYLYGHPESATDSAVLTMAGLRAALVVYEKFLAVDSAARYPLFDSLLQQRGAGKLEDALPDACKAPLKS